MFREKESHEWHWDFDTLYSFSCYMFSCTWETSVQWLTSFKRDLGGGRSELGGKKNIFNERIWMPRVLEETGHCSTWYEVSSNNWAWPTCVTPMIKWPPVTVEVNCQFGSGCKRALRWVKGRKAQDVRARTHSGSWHPRPNFELDVWFDASWRQFCGRLVLTNTIFFLPFLYTLRIPTIRTTHWDRCGLEEFCERQLLLIIYSSLFTDRKQRNYDW